MESTDSFDFEAALKISEALFGETNTETLVQRLLAIALEYGGAERGLVTFIEGDTWTATAEAVATGAGIEAPIKPRLATTVPEMIIRHVARTRQTLVLIDPPSWAPFNLDPYIVSVAPRSAVALPLVKQDRLVGVLYLENRKTSGRFSPTRLSLLKLAAFQATTALEHAKLYGEFNAALETVNASEKQFRRTIDAIPSITCITDANGQAEFLSEVWTELTGMTSQEGQGTGWLSAFHPQDIGLAVSNWGVLLAAGKAGEIEARTRLKDGSYRWLLYKAAPYRDADGRIVKWYGTAIDIEERKQAQESLTKLQAQLAHVSRVASLGELTASIAHEVYQPLTAVITNADTALRWLTRAEPDLGEAGEALKRIRGNALRTSEVIERLKRFFVRGGGEREPLDLNEAVAEMIALTHSECVRHAVTVSMVRSPSRQLVAADRVQIQQVVLNLISNAVQAMEGQDIRQLTIETRQRDHLSLVEVSDTGVGLADVDIEGLFESFKTTKPTGMGLGLSISRNIVNAHGGRLWAEPKEGRGAVFRFELPTTG